jgi:putative redox protein
MEVNVRHIDGVRFAVAARDHEILTDQPFGNGGADTGMTPPELLLAALGACIGTYAAEYLRARSLPLDGLAVWVAAEKGVQPARLARFSVTVTVPMLDEKHRTGLLRATQACLVHNTLMHAPLIEVRLKEVVPAVEQTELVPAS